jgi:hypothetical protein
MVSMFYSYHHECARTSAARGVMAMVASLLSTNALVSNSTSSRSLGDGIFLHTASEVEEEGSDASEYAKRFARYGAWRFWARPNGNCLYIPVASDRDLILVDTLVNDMMVGAQT